MKDMIAKSSWSGIEGRITRGQRFTPMTEKRAAELEKTGRAVFAEDHGEDPQKKADPEENKGGKEAKDASNKGSVENKGGGKGKKKKQGTLSLNQ